jgi:hypothetical protein
MQNDFALVKFNVYMFARYKNMSAVPKHASALRVHPMRLEPGVEIMSTLIR